MLIIFDLDDTLIDTTGSILPQSICRALEATKRGGLEIHVPLALEEILHLNASSKSSGLAVEKFFNKRGVEPKWVDVALQELYFGSLDGIEIKTREHALALLEKLAAEHTLCLVSRGEDSRQREKLEKSGIKTDWFQKIFINEEQNKGKIYKKLLREFQVKPESVIVCGDRISADLIPGKSLGFHTIHMKWGRGLSEVDTETSVDFTMESLTEFEELLNKLSL